MRFSPDILDEIRSRLPVSQVVARKVALKKRGREFVGLSPFKAEKTPSFTVNDQKGFYHCFASGEHGDIFTFVMKTEGLSFPEAVERLSAEAGVSLPKPTARDQKREDERARLLNLLEHSRAFFCSCLLDHDSGGEARRYLEKRGIRDATIEKFNIGYAPNARSDLKAHLTDLGFTPEEQARAGMTIAGSDIPVPYDRFRHRIVFPITDAKGRVIAFGGRALDPEHPAKYLNSPETPLFHKGHVLFNVARARKAAFENSRIIVVEGYMDVLALVQAGFDEAVAPLGTALTTEQLQLLWRMANEPVLCFDGDEAGKKAAYRAVGTALPHLKPGASLRFVFLPDGLDPDDVVQQGGAADFKEMLSQARPLADVLFEREWKLGNWDTPERRAGLEQKLKTLVGQIEDRGVRAHYERDIRNRLFQSWSSYRQRRGDGPSRPRTTSGSPALAASRQRSASDFRSTPTVKSPAKFGPGNQARMAHPVHKTGSGSLGDSKIAKGLRASMPSREALIIRTLINHPWLIDEHAEAIAALSFTSEAAKTLRKCILSAHAIENSLDTERLRFHLEQANLGKLLDLVKGAITHQSDRFAEPDAEIDDVEMGWRDLLSLQKHASVAHLR